MSDGKSREEVLKMEEERREGLQEQQAPETSAEVAPEEQRRGGLGAAVSFFLGLIIGALAVLAITYAAWKMPLDSANSQVEMLNSQLQMAQDRANKMRAALTRAQEALSALNEALQELSPQATGTQRQQTGGEQQTSPSE
jgi:predicted trehalose synthase